ncbi:hypothetical protein [Paenibacillus cremeus]|uniref:Uncharacterized protein n=1 Tax=Paenibacillus cremeus TaxID=2163881 RepID=A0A559K5C4_9BACL|nr:hypothetical protein [Paenibacillus cremeus]TVY07348.1 hypothetical protein FPZ49_24200 [Paenibacillus cremeus]
MRIKIDLTGRTFGLLKVVERTNQRTRPKNGEVLYRCVCACGKDDIYLPKSRLENRNERKNMRSCGCQPQEKISTAQESNDLTGKVFGSLTALFIVEGKTNKKNEKYWHCKCSCGKYKDVTTHNLKAKKVTSCGCAREKEVELTMLGKRFGRYTVMRFSRKENGHFHWMCQCDCGSDEREVFETNLLNNTSQSCGCLARELSSERRKEDLTGEVFHRLKVIQRGKMIKSGDQYVSTWLCRCECGREKVVVHGKLTSGSVKSCGCLIHEDLTGQVFDMLTVLGRSENKHPRVSLWLCQCECGSVKDIPYGALVHGHTHSCGCYKRKLYDDMTIGKQFNRLYVVDRGKFEGGQFYVCICDCGNEAEVLGVNLRNGNTVSCGCYQKERASETHFKGTSTITEYCRSRLKDWKEESKKVSNYRCVITGERFDEIHHLTPFSRIIDELIEETMIPVHETMETYNKETIQLIEQKLLELHKKYGLGVCICSDSHDEFHGQYGKETATPEDFYAFYREKRGKEFTLDLTW